MRLPDFAGYEGPRYAPEPWTDADHPLYMVLDSRGTLAQVFLLPSGELKLGVPARPDVPPRGPMAQPDFH